MMRRLLAILAFLLLPSWAWGQLALSDFVTPAGQAITMAFVGVAGTPVGSEANWPRIPWDPTGTRTGGIAIGSTAEGSTVLSTSPAVTVVAIRCQNNERCQFRQTGDGFSSLFENGTPPPYDDGTWHFQDTSGVLSAAASDTADSRVGGGFFDIDSRDGTDMGAMAARIFALAAGDRFILAFTQPSTDNCEMYLGDTDMTAPGDFRLVTLLRFYLGSSLVCGAAP